MTCEQIEPLKARIPPLPTESHGFMPRAVLSFFVCTNPKKNDQLSVIKPHVVRQGREEGGGPPFPYWSGCSPCRPPVRVAVEAAVRMGWDQWLLGERGREAKAGFIGMTGFGASAPADRLYKEFGITAEAIVKKVKSLL